MFYFIVHFPAFLLILFASKRVNKRKNHSFICVHRRKYIVESIHRVVHVWECVWESLCLGMCRKVKLVSFNSLFYGFHHCTFRAQAPFVSLHCSCCCYYWLIFVVFFLLIIMPLLSLLLGGLFVVNMCVCVLKSVCIYNKHEYIKIIQNSRIKGIKK